MQHWWLNSAKCLKMLKNGLQARTQAKFLAAVQNLPEDSSGTAGHVMKRDAFKTKFFLVDWQLIHEFFIIGIIRIQHEIPELFGDDHSSYKNISKRF